MKNDIAIQVRNVSKQFRVPHQKIDSLRNFFVSIFAPNTYEEFNALKDISFDVKKGEFLGIIGRNGAGKSTLLKVLAGIYKPDTGSVEINGRISPFLELGIGFNPELSGRDNVYLNATVLGVSREEIDEKFDEIVQFAELEEFIDQQIKNYSSGMKARLAFSVSIHANREILLMDEVLAVGDGNFQKKCLDIFKGYKNQGKTVVLVTHSMTTVRKYCDRALLFHKGMLADVGDVDSVCDKYILKNLTEDERCDLELKESTEEVEQKRIDAINDNITKKKVSITNVTLLNEYGKESDSFFTGDPVDIKIDFQVNDKIKKMDIGIGIHSFEFGQVFGCNTQMDEFTIQKKYKSVTLQLKELTILYGQYYINVICFGENENDYFDLKPMFKKIQILSEGKKSEYKGVCDLSHNWKGL